MSTTFDGFPLQPRSGALRVLVIARISTVNQDRRSLADQLALCEKYVRDRFFGETTFTRIQGQGSGEYLDRQELAEAEAQVESGKYDLVVVEDLGRVCRRNRAIDFCELCEDAGTRLLALNDSIDTARSDWRLNAFFATFKHETANKDTAARIRRSLRNRFTNGGVTQTFPYGYLKPLGTKSDADVSKDPTAEPVYAEVFRRLEDGATYAEVADWLVENNVPTGPWTRSDRWTGTMLARVVHNPILKGWRRRNERITKRVNRTGRRKSVKAPPAERLYREVPHLAFVEADRYDRLIAALAERNGEYARGRVAGKQDSRNGVPKKRTVWPGQHVVCGVCGRLMYWGGHGQQQRMMCAGVRDYRCWNAATFDGHKAGTRFARAVLLEIERLAGFDDDFRARVGAALASRQSSLVEGLRRVEAEIARTEIEVNNLTDAIARMGYSEALHARLGDAEKKCARLAAERADLCSKPDAVPNLPTVEELKERARAAVGQLAFGDPVFARQMARLVPRIVVLPYRPRDGGHTVLRAVLTVQLAPLLGAGAEFAGDGLEQTVTVDLFEPPQRVAHREDVARLRSTGETEARIAEQLGLTVTAAQRAMALDRLMRAAKVTDPYELLTTPHDDDTKVRRHRHKRYQFQPLAGFPVWANADLT